MNEITIRLETVTALFLGGTGRYMQPEAHPLALLEPPKGEASL